MSEDQVARLNATLEGRYRIERRLGEGGMATVYLADDLRHERKVALKVLKPELAAVVGAERFLAEIKTTANLQHPHILPLFDSGEADSFLFYVMPYVEGESLRERLNREHQLPVDEAVRIATNVAEALDYAHRQGVIHRDIKPANILLQDGKPVVGDFGIALAVSAAGGGRLTETGLSLGTPHYMSPEQATGDQNVGPATDIYALGCVLYEMLAGEPPYTGSTPQAILGRIITGEVEPVRKHRRSVPANVDATIRKALEKLPADRFATAAGLAATLHDAAFQYGEGAEVGGEVGRGLWNPLSIALGGVAVAAAVVAVWALLRAAPPRPVRRETLSADGWAGPNLPRLGQYFAIAPDGSSTILPLGSSATDVRLGLKVRRSTEIAPIPRTERARSVVYSPDGQSIAYVVGTELFKQPLFGGSRQRLADDVEGGGGGATALAWLDDGTIVYEQAPPAVEPGLGPRGFVRIPEDGGEASVVLWPAADEGSPVAAQGLPGGRGALVIIYSPFTGGSLFAVDLGDLSHELIMQHVLRAWYARTGHLVYVRDDGSVLALPFDLGALRVTGGAVGLLDGVRTSAPVADMQLAADGTLLYVEGSSAYSGQRQLVTMDLEGNEQVLPLSPRPIFNAAWSPDGASVAYASQDEIYTYDAELNSAPIQITFEGTNSNPVYSPDGRQVAFSSVRDGTEAMDLFVKDLGDDSPPRPVLTLPGNQQVAQWPTDTLIVLVTADRANGDLWAVDLSDPDSPSPRAYLSSEANLQSPAVSPDGALVAYGSDESGRNEIYVRSFPDPGEATMVSRGGASVPFWSPTGDTLYYSTPAGAYVATRLQRDPVLSVLSTDTLFTLPLAGSEPPPGALHPDGDRFILALSGDPGDGARPERVILVQNFFEELKGIVGS